MDSPSAFYERDGDQLVSTELTRGPWDPGLQHGGPPSALLARALEVLGGEMRLMRLSVEILRPIPIAPLSVHADVTRAGRMATWLAGTLTCGGKEVARATATAIRVTERELPAHPRPSATMPPVAESTEPTTFSFFGTALGYHTAIELRLARGEWGVGPCAAWMRLRVPLVAGEETSALQRVVVCADAGNGVSITLPIREWTAINPDLGVYLHRLPEGDWIGLDAVTVPEASGIGLAESRLHDALGPIGRSLQSLVVERRRAP
jgi:hypothetical protein